MKVVDSDPEDDSVLFSRQRQLLVLIWFCWYDAPHAVFPSIGARARRRQRQWQYFTGFAGIYAPRAVFPAFFGMSACRGREKCAQSMLQLFTSST